MTKNPPKLPQYLQNPIRETRGHFKDLKITEITVKDDEVKIRESPAELAQLQEEHATLRARLEHKASLLRNALVVLLLLGVCAIVSATAGLGAYAMWFGVANIAAVAGVFGYSYLRVKTPIAEAQLTKEPDTQRLETKKVHSARTQSKKRSRRSRRRR